MKNFAMIGVGGYVAPRHLKAIKETGNNLLCSLDKSDSVGIMDSFFPKAEFFTEFEIFDKFICDLRDSENKIDYVSITTPNYLHDPHIRCALKNGADAICEKPLVLNVCDIDRLKDIERQTGKKVYNILQLRLHESIVNLKNKISQELKENPNRIYDIDLTYLTSRGKWYFESWKGDVRKSGGIATNIGVHFFDMLTWIFGDVKRNLVHIKQNDVNAGFLELEHANVRWFLSVNYNYIPQDIKEKDQRTYRSIKVDGKEIEFSTGFFDLHTKSYIEILNGNGFGLDNAYNCIKLVSFIRSAEISPMNGDYHPFCKKVK